MGYLLVETYTSGMERLSLFPQELRLASILWPYDHDFELYFADEDILIILVFFVNLIITITYE